MTKAIDLFAGFGGWSTGARAAGVQVLWAANHWPEAVKWHSANHPDTQHVCQDLHQARWEQAPAHDILLASPCCQGHAKARGKKSGNPEHDASRSTAWAPASALEVHRPPAAVIENVPEFTELCRPRRAAAPGTSVHGADAQQGAADAAIAAGTRRRALVTH